MQDTSDAEINTVIEPARSRGRPTLKTEELCDSICERLARGETLTAICNVEGAPDYKTVWRWLQSDENFRQNYARAREAQAEYFADEIVDICRGATAETANAVRVQMDGMKWHASKTAPKRWGDKPAEVTVNNTNVVGITCTEEQRKRLTDLRAELYPGNKARELLPPSDAEEK